MFPASPGAPPAPPVAADDIFAALSASLSSTDGAAREAASTQLQRWERSAAPGFAAGLVDIASRANDVPEAARLLAVVTLKNTVGASWRKTLASREWARVPEPERAYVRGACEALLLREPSERVALHCALLIANIARFDAPRRWPGLLPSLLAASRWEEGGTSAAGKARALRCLKHVFTALGGTRASTGGAAGAAEDARATRAAASALFPQLAAEWRAHADAAAHADRARLALRCLAALRGIFRLLPGLSAPELGVPALMEAFLSHLSAGVEAPGAAAAAGEAAALRAKHFRLVAECVAAAMDSSAPDFVPFLGPFVAVFARGVLQLPPDALGEDPKRAHVLTRFLANALLCPAYKPRRPPAADLSGGDGLAPGSPPDSPPPLISADDDWAALLGRAAAPSAEEQARSAAVAQAAEAAFAPLFEGDALVRALVERYLVPTQAELDEWRADPEALLAAGEPAAAGADTDSPRPCAETLLLCLLLRDRQRVAATALRLAAQAQATPVDSGDAAAVLFRDGVYRAIGVLAPELPTGAVDFAAWLRGELAPLLAAHAAAADGARCGDAAAAQQAASLPRRLLAARALWLIGRFSEAVVEPPRALPPGAGPDASAPVCGPLTRDAVGAILPHLAPEDPLLALHAAAALRALCSGVASAASSSLWRGTGVPGVSPQRAASDAVAPWGVAALSRCLALLPALPEPESMASVLRLCGLLLDLLGRRRLAPHTAALANALPAVWHAVDARAQGEPGAGARAHAALLGALAHLVAVLGTAALAGDAGGAGAVLFPLLAYATDPAAPHREALLDDGVALWLAALRASVAMCEPMAALAPRLFHLLQCDPSMGLVLALQGYILIGGPAWLEAHAAAVVAALAPPLLSVEPAAERALLTSAAALDLAVQMCPQQVFAHLAPVLAQLPRRLALMHGGSRRAEADPEGAALIPTAVAAKAYTGLLTRAALHAPSAAWELCGGDAPLTAATVAVWAELASLRHMAELLGSGAAAAARRAAAGGAGPPAASEWQAERHLAALALCGCVAAAAAAPDARAAGLDGGPASGPAAVVRAVAPVLALAVQALADLRSLTGDAAASGPLPLPPAAGGAAGGEQDEEDGAMPNQVDAAAYRLTAADPVHAVPLRAAAVAALRAARAALGDDALRAALDAEERLADMPPLRRELLQAVLAEAF